MPVSVVTDPKMVVIEPAPPRVERWQRFLDPTFGTQILRLTGPEDGENLGVSYGMWPVFNCDDTRMLVQGNNVGYLFNWIPGSGTVISREELPAWLQVQDAIWSHTDPQILYNRAGLGISAYNVATGVNTPVVDWSQKFADAPFSFRMSASENDDVFVWARETTDYRYVGWGAYQRSTGRYWQEPKERFGEYFKVQIDKSGRWVWNISDALIGKGIGGEVFDLLNGGALSGQMTVLAPDWAPGHSALGPGWIVGADAGEAADTRRAFSDLHKFVYTYGPSGDWSVTTEYSMLNRDNQWYYVTFTEYPPHKDAVFHDELVAIATDGSQSVRRLAHLHMAMEINNGNYNYYTISKPSVSYSGKFVAFDSNWGQPTGRRDVYIVRIP